MNFFVLSFLKEMFDCFELSDFKEKPDQIEIYFEEKNIHPKEYTTDKLESKGGVRTSQNVFREKYRDML